MGIKEEITWVPYEPNLGICKTKIEIKRVFFKQSFTRKK